MNEERLQVEKNKAEIRVSKIDRILKNKITLCKAIKDLEYLQEHAGEMIFTGNSGRIGEREVMLRTVKINILGGCVEVPRLLISLAKTKLKDLEKEASLI